MLLNDQQALNRLKNLRSGKQDTPEARRNRVKALEASAKKRGITYSQLQSLKASKRWKKPNVLARTKPWEQEGISRSTWYKKRRNRPDQRNRETTISFFPRILSRSGKTVNSSLDTANSLAKITGYE